MPLMGKVRGLFRRSDEHGQCPPLDTSSVDSLVAVLSFPESPSDAPKVLEALVAICSTNSPDTSSTDPPLLTFNLAPLAKPLANKILSSYIQISDTALDVVRYLLLHHTSTLILHAPTLIPALLLLTFHPPSASLLSEPLSPSFSSPSSSSWKSFFSRSTPPDLLSQGPDEEDRDTRASQAHRLIQDMVLHHHIPQIVAQLCHHLSVSSSTLYPPAPLSEEEEEVTVAGSKGEKSSSSPAQITPLSEPISEQVVEWIATAVESMPLAPLLPYASELESMIQYSALDPSVNVRQCSVRVYLIYLRLPFPPSSPSPVQYFQSNMPDRVRKSLSAGLRAALIERRVHRSPSTKSDESTTTTTSVFARSSLHTWSRSLSAGSPISPSSHIKSPSRRTSLIGGSRMRKWRDSRTTSMLIPSPTPRIDLPNLLSSSPSSPSSSTPQEDDFVAGTLAGLGKIRPPDLVEEEEGGEDSASDHHLSPPGTAEAKSVRPSRSDSGLPALANKHSKAKAMVDGKDKASSPSSIEPGGVKASSWSLRRGLSSLWKGQIASPSPTLVGKTEEFTASTLAPPPSSSSTTTTTTTTQAHPPTPSTAASG
ncbi:MAG: hypothetical protein DHS80DRAFT_25626 [Piptocephalis tieghemiana]|nr:MAG: hypothetical protein DHS80DRAFT_25626 [Piptocephalis tieghemiana]